MKSNEEGCSSSRQRSASGSQRAAWVRSDDDPGTPAEILHSYSDRNLVSYRACEDRLPICLHAPAQIDPRQHPILRAPQRAPRCHLATPVAAEADRSASRGSDPEHQLCVCRRRGSQPRPCSRARAMWDSARYVRCRDQRIRSDVLGGARRPRRGLHHLRDRAPPNIRRATRHVSTNRPPRDGASALGDPAETRTHRQAPLSRT